MSAFFAQCEVFEGLRTDALSRLAAVMEPRSVKGGDNLFLLGQEAEHLYVVRSGSVDMCLPVGIRGEVKQVPVETKGPGSAIGWSAFVTPYRFRLSARAAEDCEVGAFPRKELMRLFDDDHHAGYTFHQRIAEVIGERLLKVQALWARELQRAFSGAVPVHVAQPNADSSS